MGCGSSKAEETPLVALCRERRELIRAAAQHRFALAAAHAAYFRALGRVGDALHRFVQEELVSAPALVPPASPVLTLPPSEGKGKAKAKIVRSAGESGNGGELGASASTLASISHSQSHSHSHSGDSHLHLPSDFESEEITGESSRLDGRGGDSSRSFSHHQFYGARGLDGRGEDSARSFSHHQFYGAHGLDGRGEDSARSFSHHQFYGAPTPNYFYMKSASTISSTTVYQNPYPGWSNTAYMGFGYGYGYGYAMNDAPVNPPQQLPVQDDNFYHQSQPLREDKPADPPPPPPPPPPPDGSAWDFFNPFDSYEHMIPGFYREAYGGGSVTSSPNSSEVREKEGIPELEEETEQESVKEPLKERKGAYKDGSERDLTKRNLKAADKDFTARVSSEGINNVAANEREASGKAETVASQVNEESRVISSASKVKEDEEEISTKNKSVSFRDEASLVTDDSLPSKESALFVQGTRDVMEVVEEIKEQFDSAANCGNDVSKILEVGKLSYRSRNKTLKVILSRLFYPVIVPVQTSRSSAMNSQQQAGRSLKAKQVDFVSCEDIDTGKLSSTLEKLYMWEKRLHKIVEEEERLRVIYEREWRQLKALDESGAESLKIDSIRASIRNLLTKLNIAIKSANHISSRIHNLRDGELRPQLIELIQGYTQFLMQNQCLRKTPLKIPRRKTPPRKFSQPRQLFVYIPRVFNTKKKMMRLVKMWKVVLDCHHRQVQSIIESKCHNLVARTGSSVAKATIELEVELLNWQSCFTNWIHAQKAYIESLNGWMLKWLLQERVETPDGVPPFSPSRIGAPDAFVITNDWHQIVARISENEVIDTMQSFAINVHRLSETQDEEQRQKLRAEYLSKDFERRLRSLRKENGMNGHEHVPDKTVLPISNGNEAFDHEKMSLDAIKRRLDEEKAKHEAAIKQVQQATASNLRMGLAPIFQALENFFSETLKGYEGVRISNGDIKF